MSLYSLHTLYDLKYQSVLNHIRYVRNIRTFKVFFFYPFLMILCPLSHALRLMELQHHISCKKKSKRCHVENFFGLYP